jgi:hypothetical protein
LTDVITITGASSNVGVDRWPRTLGGGVLAARDRWSAPGSSNTGSRAWMLEQALDRLSTVRRLPCLV